MYNYKLHQKINLELQKQELDISGKDNLFYTRFMANASALHALYMDLYERHPKALIRFDELISMIIGAYKSRSEAQKLKDEDKQQKGFWFLSNNITGMSLYVDRFCGSLQNLEKKLFYFKELGVNFLHLMPIFQSPAGESDGGYAVSDFRKVDERFGTLEHLQSLQKKMSKEQIYLMIDIVLNHTSHHHEWAEKAKQGDAYYQDFFYMYDNRTVPDEYEKTLPEVFPDTAPGSFTYNKECKKWVMTVFHNYQWDLNYTNPSVLVAMMDTIFFYANLGVDVLRIDAPAFIWKQTGTTSQNLPQAHTILQLIKQCVQIATPGMALLAEAIVAPKEILKYFGTGLATAKECDFAYNATQMAVQWDTLATGNVKLMYAAQQELLKKPYGTSWITYTRCHDDIGLGYNDYMIRQAGFDPFQHRNFIKNYYTGNFKGSSAVGAPFSTNPKTGDARISGSLASLCGLEKAIIDNNADAIETAIKKIMLMQAQSFFIGGIPMIFYGDEAGYTNDYSYLNDTGKAYDNRWMHRPVIDWDKNKQIKEEGTIAHRIFMATQKLISIRKAVQIVTDEKNLIWLTPHNIHVAGFLRANDQQQLFCLYNYHAEAAYLTWYVFKENGFAPTRLFDHYTQQYFEVGADNEYLIIPPYSFYLLEPKV